MVGYEHLDFDECWGIDEKVFEEKRIKYILRKFDLMHRKMQLLADQHDNSQRNFDWRITFDSFNKSFPSFPIILGAYWYPPTHKASSCEPAALFRNFEEAPFVMVYEDLCCCHPHMIGKKTIGLIFPFGGIRQGLVIHNGHDFHTESMKWVYEGGKTDPPKLYVESFALLIQAIAKKGWQPAPDEA